jgi:glycerol-3-phosphate dehydrogenase (NAD(P)+)
VELGGALKNVYAVAAGLLDGLGLGDSSKASLSVRSLHELVKVATALGADLATINGLAGVGDLMATSFSRLGRNRMVGEAIGGGRRLLSFKPASVLSLRDSQPSRLLQKSLN